MPYIVKNLEVRLQDFGNLQQSHLYAITSGQRNNKSLLFHVKIAAVFHTLFIAKVNKKSVNMGCVDVGCRARHKFEIDEKFVKCIADFYKSKNGKCRPKFYIDYSDPEVRDVTNCQITVKSHDSKPHKENEKADFFTHIQKEFREDHTSLALESFQCELRTTIRMWNLRRYGPQFEAEIVRNKVNEQKSSWFKINHKMGYSGKSTVPSYCSDVGCTNWEDPELNLMFEKHYQCSTESQHVFFLDSELYNFGTHDLVVDGTFHLIKNQKDLKQVYIISVLYSSPSGDATSYPMLFSLMRNRFTLNYIELFEIINQAYFANMAASRSILHDGEN